MNQDLLLRLSRYEKKIFKFRPWLYILQKVNYFAIFVTNRTHKPEV